MPLPPSSRNTAAGPFPADEAARLAETVRTASRRAVVAGVVTLPVAALAGCSVYSSGSGPAPAAPAPSGAAGTASEGAPALAGTADIPIGGGTIFKDQRVVVTQPTAGTFRAMSSVCTHEGCDVASVEGGKILCPCHGSAFALDGSVVRGPATVALPARNVRVSGAQIFLG